MPGVVFHVVDPPEGTVVPGWVNDLASFSRWAESPGFPETGRVSYIQGDVWMDMSMEELFTHNQLKVLIASDLQAVVRAHAMGYLFGDGARFRNPTADLSVEPDAMFASFDAIRGGRVVLTEGADDGYMYVEGSPEWVLEVVSNSSVRKDTVDLPPVYYEAGIAEYWMVDARGETVHFSVLKRGPRGYTTTRPQAGGWLKSAVFGKSFRITQATDPLGHPQFTLEHRD